MFYYFNFESLRFGCVSSELPLIGYVGSSEKSREVGIKPEYPVQTRTPGNSRATPIFHFPLGAVATLTVCGRGMKCATLWG